MHVDGADPNEDTIDRVFAARRLQPKLPDVAPTVDYVYHYC
jgi:hypothetical protein